MMELDNGSFPVGERVRQKYFKLILEVELLGPEFEQAVNLQKSKILITGLQSSQGCVNVCKITLQMMQHCTYLTLTIIINDYLTFKINF